MTKQPKTDSPPFLAIDSTVYDTISFKLKTAKGDRMIEDFTPREHFGHKEVGYKFRAGPRIVTPTQVDQFCDLTGTNVAHFLSDEAGQALNIGSRGRILPGILPLLYPAPCSIRLVLLHPACLLDLTT